MKRAWMLLLALAVISTMAPHWTHTTTAWAYGPIQANGMRLAVRSIPAPAGQAPVGIAGGTPHLIQFAIGPSPTVGIDGYNLYGALVAGGENGTMALNGNTLIPNAQTTSTSGGCPPAIVPCVLYTLNQPTLQNGFYVAAASQAGNQSAFSPEVGPIAVPVNPQAPGAVTVPNKQ